MALLQSDFLIVRPIRTKYEDYPIRDISKIGLPNLSTDGGMVFDASLGNCWRNTLPDEIQTSAVTGTYASEDYERYNDDGLALDASERITYQNFADYHKIYVFNNGLESLPDVRFTVTSTTRVLNDNASPIWKTYIALGLSDASDYTEIETPIYTRDYYPDLTVIGFPRISSNDTPGEDTILDAKVAKDIIYVGRTSSTTPYDAPRGPHKIVRKIESDYNLYAERKYLKATATNITTILADVDIYVFGETNSQIVVGICTSTGDFKLADDGVSPVSFHKIYGIFCVDKTPGYDITCWNDFTEETLSAPPQDVTIQWKLVSGTVWTDWVVIKTTNKFSLTFFDEEILDHGRTQALCLSPSPKVTDFIQSTTLLHTLANSSLTPIVNDSTGLFTLQEDTNYGLVEFDSPGSDLTSVSLADRVVGVDVDGVIYDLGYIVELNTTPSDGLGITVSNFDTSLTTLSCTVQIYSTKYSRAAFWFRREIACQVDVVPTTEVDMQWMLYGLRGL